MSSKNQLRQCLARASSGSIFTSPKNILKTIVKHFREDCILNQMIKICCVFWYHIMNLILAITMITDCHIYQNSNGYCAAKGIQDPFFGR